MDGPVGAFVAILEGREAGPSDSLVKVGLKLLVSMLAIGPFAGFAVVGLAVLGALVGFASDIVGLGVVGG